MLEGSFKEAQSPISFVDVFKMVIEWIYTMDISRLNGLSSIVFYDLEKVYFAADMYLIPDLCFVMLNEWLISQKLFTGCKERDRS
jgi:hypothetical protein